MRDILRTPASKRSTIRALLLIALLPCIFRVAAEDSVPKLVYLIIDRDTLIASNIEFNRFDDLKLAAKEIIVKKQVGNAVIVVVTNKRIIGYSVYTASWRTKVLSANERVEKISGEDYSALVVTSKRILSFNGKNGVWAQTQREKIFQN